MPEPATESGAESLEITDQTIDTAISEQNRAVLEALLADDFIYTHSNGRSQDKAAFIGGVVARENPSRRLLSGIAVELHGEICVTRGDLDIEYRDDRPNHYMRYVRVYRRTGGGWRAFSHRTVYADDRQPTT